jgi:hypothetical protein
MGNSRVEHKEPKLEDRQQGHARQTGAVDAFIVAHLTQDPEAIARNGFLGDCNQQTVQRGRADLNSGQL